MMQRTQSQPIDDQAKTREPRIFVPGREFSSTQEYVSFLREAEVVRLYGAGLLI